MKNLVVLIALSSFVLFSSCEGDQGPPGPEGPPGVTILGQVFEVTIDLPYDAETGLRSAIVVFPSNVEVFNSDVVLVYRLEKVVDIDGSSLDAWSQLPQNFFLNETDIIQYVFNHTFEDAEIIIDGNFDLVSLGNQFIQNQIFRIAIVPSEFARSNLTMEELLQGINALDDNVIKLN